MIGKTDYVPIPIAQWMVFKTAAAEIPRTKEIQKYRDVQILITKEITKTSTKNASKIRPTAFKDFRNSPEYKRIWKRTHRGFHWLPPKPTISPC